MQKNHELRQWLALALTLMLSLTHNLVLAHTDANVHAHLSWMAGLLHPLTGADHLAAMVAVGIWGALSMRRVWLAPAVFVVAMGVGIFSGVMDLDPAGVEPMIALSVLVLGLAIGVGTRQTWSVRLALGGVAVFGVCHGAAHGLALQGSASPAPILAMLLSTALLHVCGVWLGAHVLASRLWLQRVSGAVFALLGLTLLSAWA